MKSLTEILNSPETTATVVQSSPYNSVSNTDPVLENAKIAMEPPAYMYTEPGAVGYESVEIQNDTYRFAISGVIPLSGKTSILDIGAGRGDLLFYIRSLLPSLEITEYLGYESNKLLAEIGRNKIYLDQADASQRFSWIVDEDFLTAPIKEGTTYDHVFAIGTFNLDYGWTTDDWTHVELMLTRAFAMANHSVTLVMIHDNGGFDTYKSFPIPNMTDLVLQLNCSFTVDYDNETGVYKLTLQKN